MNGMIKQHLIIYRLNVFTTHQINHLHKSFERGGTDEPKGTRSECKTVNTIQNDLVLHPKQAYLLSDRLHLLDHQKPVDWQMHSYSPSHQSIKPLLLPKITYQTFLCLITQKPINSLQSSDLAYLTPSDPTVLVTHRTACRHDAQSLFYHQYR